MKRITMYIVMALVVVLAAGALAGCGQSASSSSAAASSSSAAVSSSSSTSGASKDEVIAELKSAAEKSPEFKSVTVNETTAWTYVDGSTAKRETSQATGVYKFDMSGEQLKESVSAEYEAEKLQLFIDGNSAVFVGGGTAYSGTVEQFGAQDYSGFDTFIKHVIGDLDALVSCTTAAEKTESSGLTFYLLTIDPEKCIESDEALAALAKNGLQVKEAFLTVGFDEKGYVNTMDLALSYGDSGIVETLLFSDFNSTVVDPAPEATKTYEEMEEAMKQEIQQTMKELDSYAASTNGAASSSSSKAN